MDAPAPNEHDRFLQSISQELERLARFQAGWDSYDARPIDRDIIHSIEKLIASLYRVIDFEKPIVVPCSSGGVQLEWHRETKILELEFERPDKIHYLRWQPEAQIEDEGFCSSHEVSRVVNLIEWLMSTNEAA